MGDFVSREDAIWRSKRLDVCYADHLSHYQISHLLLEFRTFVNVAQLPSTALAIIKGQIWENVVHKFYFD